ncbi:MAG TPA: hypothetical protein VMI55_07940 [Thermoplasmata archaeon]|nr:hypothetical protein [Thermoplasmata archaeon]
MPVASLRYTFRQPFRAPAKAAYEWCTDFGPSDGGFFEPKWRRVVQRLSDDALILRDTTYPAGKRRVIERLVRLNPTDLAWTNTHISGPFRHSQYWYRIVADGPRRSHLEFLGMRLLRTPKALRSSEVARLAEEERRVDSRLWRQRLAPALERDLA